MDDIEEFREQIIETIIPELKDNKSVYLISYESMDNKSGILEVKATIKIKRDNGIDTIDIHKEIYR